MSIILSAQTLQPAYNPCIWVANSSNQTKENFKYYFEIIDAENNKVLQSLTIPQNLQGYGVVDISKTLQSQVESVIHIRTGFTQTELKHIFPYKIVQGDSYLYEWPFQQISSASTSVARLINVDNITPLYKPGDKIRIKQQTGYLNPSLEGVTTVITGYTSLGIYFLEVENNNTINDTVTGNTTYSDKRSVVQNITTGDTKFVFNGSESFNSFMDWDSTQYQLGNITAGKFLSDVPQFGEFKVKKDNSMYLYAFQYPLNSEVSRLTIITDDGNQYKITSPNNNRLSYYIGVGPKQLNNSTLSFGTQPVIKDTTKSYMIVVENSASAATSSFYEFKIDDSCPGKYDNFELIFQDRKGSFIPMNFSLAYSKNVDVNKKNYKTMIGTYNGTSNKWGYNTYDRGSKRLNTDVKESYTITSNWYNKELNFLMEQLLSSPQVYWIKDDKWIAIDLDVNSLEIKNNKKDKLFNYSISFTISNRDTIQNA
jgi:hypothetical protein